MDWRILRIYVVSIVLGILTGAIGSLFQLAIKWSDKGLAYFYAFTVQNQWPTNNLSPPTADNLNPYSAPREPQPFPGPYSAEVPASRDY